MATKPTFSPDQDMENVTPKDLKDAKTRTKERKAYKEASKIEPDKGKSLMDYVEKYNPGAKESVAEGEKATEKYGSAAAEEFKKGNYGSAAKEGLKGLGSAAKTLAVDVPVEAARAGMNRLKYGEKKMAKGGTASSRADGCCTKGKTRGKMI